MVLKTTASQPANMVNAMRSSRKTKCKTAERRVGQSTAADTSRYYGPLSTRPERPERQWREHRRHGRLENNFEVTRDELDYWMRELGWLFPTGRGWLYSTKSAEIGDMVHVPWPVFCKDKNVVVIGDHYWLPSHGGYILVKYRWGMVHNKDRRGKLHMWFAYTFTNTSMTDKRLEKVEDEDTGEPRPALRDYMHVVTADEKNREQVVVDEPLCFEEGLQLNCKSVNGYHAEKKGSFLRLDEVCVHENGTLLQVRAKVVGREEITKLLKAHDAMTKRTKTALERAANTWSETPTTSPMPGSVVPVSSPIPSQDVLQRRLPEANISLPEAPVGNLSAHIGKEIKPSSTLVSAQDRKEVMSTEDQYQAPTGIDYGSVDNVAMQPTTSLSNDVDHSPDTLMDHLALQTAVVGSGHQDHESRHHQTQRDQLPEPLNPSPKSQRNEGRKRKADSPELDGREACRRRQLD